MIDRIAREYYYTLLPSSLVTCLAFVLVVFYDASPFDSIVYFFPSVLFAAAG